SEQAELPKACRHPGFGGRQWPVDCSDARRGLAVAHGRCGVELAGNQQDQNQDRRDGANDLCRWVNPSARHRATPPSSIYAPCQCTVGAWRKSGREGVISRPFAAVRAAFWCGVRATETKRAEPEGSARSKRLE